MGTNNMISANGKVIFIAEEKTKSPFIYRGNLDDVELRSWLRSVEYALELKNSSTNCVEELNLEIKQMKTREAERNEFISASVYPTDPDPIHRHDSPDIWKQTPMKNTHEN
ncbi:Uncharacterised protein [Serratia proteamaculans]|nr:Uncharacterised protein [Serratia proteamaculans]